MCNLPWTPRLLEKDNSKMNQAFNTQKYYKCSQCRKKTEYIVILTSVSHVISSLLYDFACIVYIVGVVIFCFVIEN